MIFQFSTSITALPTPQEQEQQQAAAVTDLGGTLNSFSLLGASNATTDQFGSGGSPV